MPLLLLLDLRDERVVERFGALGGVDLPDLPREPIRAVDLGE